MATQALLLGQRARTGSRSGGGTLNPAGIEPQTRCTPVEACYITRALLWLARLWPESPEPIRIEDDDSHSSGVLFP